MAKLQATPPTPISRKSETLKAIQDGGTSSKKGKDDPRRKHPKG